MRQYARNASSLQRRDKPAYHRTEADADNEAGARRREGRQHANLCA